MTNEGEPKNAFSDFIGSLDLADFDGPGGRDADNSSEGEIGEMVEGQIEWTTREMRGERVNFTAIEAYGVQFIHTHHNNFEMLNWKASLPNFLIPGCSGSKLVNFERLFYYELPEKLGSKFKSEQEAINAFRQESRIEMPPDSSGKSRSYDFYKRGDLYNFAAEFLKPTDGKCPESLRINPKRPNHNKEFSAKITYGEFDNTQGEIHLYLSHAESIRANWTESLLSWALATHANGRHLNGNTSASESLLQAIRGNPQAKH